MSTGQEELAVSSREAWCSFLVEEGGILFAANSSDSPKNEQHSLCNNGAFIGAPPSRNAFRHKTLESLIGELAFQRSLSS